MRTRTCRLILTLNVEDETVVPGSGSADGNAARSNTVRTLAHVAVTLLYRWKTTAWPTNELDAASRTENLVTCLPRASLDSVTFGRTLKVAVELTVEPAAGSVRAWKAVFISDCAV